MGRAGRWDDRTGVVQTGSSVAFSIAIAVTVLTLPLIFGVYFSVYFSLGEPAPPPTRGDEVTYEMVAGLCVVASAIAVIAACARKSVWRVVVALLLVPVVLGTAYLFSVPIGRWEPEPVTHELPDDYVPCYGEGDPNCAAG